MNEIMKKRTEELMRMLEKGLPAQDQNIVALINSHAEEFSKVPLPECLSGLLLQYNMKKSDVIKRSGINQIYAYQIFAGTKSPSRDKLIGLMFGFMLSVNDSNRLLKSAELSNLYPRDKRDAVIIFGLHHQLNIHEVDDLLFELDLVYVPACLPLASYAFAKLLLNISDKANMFKFALMVILVNLLLRNTALPILVTLSGIIILVNLLL